MEKSEERVQTARASRANLRIDNVLSTQPELGPSVPDGGYGWLILMASSFFQLTVPSLLLSYGIFLMFSKLELNTTRALSIWDNPMVNAPVFFIATWTIMDPICRLIIANSRWPRLVTLCGVCLTCAGILFFWLAIINPHLLHTATFGVGGCLSGFGAALVLAQCEVLINQFFRLKLSVVQTLLSVSTQLGFIGSPTLLGYYINRNGLAHVIVWYHLYILTGTVVCMLFRKPDYLKSKKSYAPVRELYISENEDEIFTKSSTELRVARSQAIELPSTSGEVQVEIHREGWEKFDEEADDKVNELSLEEEFEEETHKSWTHTPSELYSEIQVNNNMTYSFDNAEVTNATEDHNVFMPVLLATNDGYKFFMTFTFYASVFLQITIKQTWFALYSLFPSKLFFATNMHKEAATAILSYIFCGSLLLAITVRWMKIHRKNRDLFLAMFLYLGCTGSYMVAHLVSEAGLIIGAIFLTFSLTGMEFISEPMLQLDVKSEPNRMYIFLNLISGFSFILHAIINFSLNRFFGFIGFLQLINAFLWLCIYLYKKYKVID